MNAALVLGVGAVGAVGAVARFVLDGVLRRHLGTRLPWSTLLINIAGSALLGALTGSTIAGALPEPAHVILGVGFCSSFTTFSTAVWETLTVSRRGRTATALVYTLMSAATTTAAAAIGLAAGLAAG